MAIAKVWSAKHAFDGLPKVDDFLLTEETLPALKDGEILIEALYLSLDPYMRVMPVEEGLYGEQVARIIESKAPGFPVGGLVCAHVGWRSKTVVDVNKPLRFDRMVELIDVPADLSPSLWIGAIGMPGMTAYLSFLERCDPKKGEVIVVSTASGAVGSIVGQLAKMQGLKVVGLAGSKKKCDYVKEIGFDHAINYKLEEVSAVLDEIAPEGVDIYYDNVGGDISDTVYNKLKLKGRVLVCGQISAYNTPQLKVSHGFLSLIFKELRIEGFYVYSPDNVKELPRVRKSLVSLIQQGKLKAKEHITEGFENMPKALIELFTGDNFGKAVVKTNVK